MATNLKYYYGYNEKGPKYSKPSSFDIAGVVKNVVWGVGVIMANKPEWPNLAHKIVDRKF